MASALKCDRCGTCFDPLNLKDECITVRFRNPIFRTGEHIRNRAIGYYLVDESADYYVDLCPYCAKDFALFMDGNPLSIHSNDFDIVSPEIKTKNLHLNIPYNAYSDLNRNSE